MSGRLRIAVIDSGIHASHPHVGGIAGAVHITASGFGDDPVDRLGHGTAVAAAIREKVPDADLFGIKVFDRRLSANVDQLLRALEWCRQEGMDFINLSLGTSNAQHREPLVQAVADNGIIVSAAQMLPGGLHGVISVDADEACQRDQFRFSDGVYYASPYPRSIQGVPPSDNLRGVSFAVANMTGLAARIFADFRSGSPSRLGGFFNQLQSCSTSSKEGHEKSKVGLD